MYGHHRSGAKVESGSPDFTWMASDAVKVPVEITLETVHMVLVVHHQQQKVFFVSAECLVNRLEHSTTHAASSFSLLKWLQSKTICIGVFQ